jgi:hypothetical protein
MQIKESISELPFQFGLAAVVRASEYACFAVPSGAFGDEGPAAVLPVAFAADSFANTFVTALPQFLQVLRVPRAARERPAVAGPRRRRGGYDPEGMPSAGQRRRFRRGLSEDSSGRKCPVVPLLGDGDYAVIQPAEPTSKKSTETMFAPR